MTNEPKLSVDDKATQKKVGEVAVALQSFEKHFETKGKAVMKAGKKEIKVRKGKEKESARLLLIAKLTAAVRKRDTHEVKRLAKQFEDMNKGLIAPAEILEEGMRELKPMVKKQKKAGKLLAKDEKMLAKDELKVGEAVKVMKSADVVNGADKALAKKSIDGAVVRDVKGNMVLLANLNEPVDGTNKHQLRKAVRISREVTDIKSFLDVRHRPVISARELEAFMRLHSKALSEKVFAALKQKTILYRFGTYYPEHFAIEAVAKKHVSLRPGEHYYMAGKVLRNLDIAHLNKNIDKALMRFRENYIKAITRWFAALRKALVHEARQRLAKKEKPKQVEAQIMSELKQKLDGVRTKRKGYLLMSEAEEDRYYNHMAEIVQHDLHLLLNRQTDQITNVHHTIIDMAMTMDEAFKKNLLFDGLKEELSPLIENLHKELGELARHLRSNPKKPQIMKTAFVEYVKKVTAPAFQHYEHVGYNAAELKAKGELRFLTDIRDKWFHY